MGKNRVFFPQEALDQWISEGRVDLAGDEITINPDARRYRIVEAVRILNECTGLGDANELVGRVKTRMYLGELGAELLEKSMVLGDNAYDVVPGFLGEPVGTFEEHLAGAPRTETTRPGTAAGAEGAVTPVSDEDILAKFLLENL